MAMKIHLKSVIVAACMLFSLAIGEAGAADVPLVTGEHWMRSSEPLKKAYLLGIANMIQLEATYEGPNPVPDGQGTIPRFARGLKGQTLDSVREALDAWYAAHPDRQQQPVIETIWFELVVPGLRKNG